MWEHFSLMLLFSCGWCFCTGVEYFWLGAFIVEVRVRNVSPVLVGKLDSKAREKGLSREEFLREQLEVIAYMDVLSEHRKSVNQSLGEVANSFEDVSDKLAMMEEKYEKLVYLISFVTEIDLHDMELFIDEQMKGKQVGSD